ncbi:MAG: pyruvate, water dikinase regulatory protein [Xanthomonadales bacterium]|nr:pyruvate, water dikinase regulatory protein [Xanthomonadales bacterium]
MQRTIFFISDGTGITAETIGHSLLTQFEGIEFKQIRVPFVDSVEKAKQACARITAAAEKDGARPIVINTLVEPRLSEVILNSDGLVLDIFEVFIGRLEKELGVKRSPRVGQAHGLVDYQTYENRMDATNYALKHDDGADVNYENADVILTGVSRSGKTPTCLYLALHYGVKAGNYPLTPDDLDLMELPPRLKPHRDKLFGLTIDPMRLHQIRTIRRPNSRYSELKQCRREVAEAENLFRMQGIASLNTTHTSIEEIASKILVAFDLERNMF